MTNFKSKLTGERINLFENSLTNDVKSFNLVFSEFKLDLPENQEIEIGEIKRVNCYEIITNGEKFDHYFERRKLDESIIDYDFNEFNDDY